MWGRTAITVGIGLAAGLTLGGAWVAMTGSCSTRAREGCPQAAGLAGYDFHHDFVGEDSDLIGWLYDDTLDWLEERTALHLVYGCRGDRENAVLVSGMDLEAIEGIEDVCLTDVQLELECPPCKPMAEELADADVEDRRMMAEDYRTEYEDWKTWTATHRQLLAGIEREFTEGPWVQVSVEGPEDEAMRKEQLFVYVMTFREQGDCSEEETFPTLRVLPEAIEWPAPGERATVWRKAVRYENALHGLVVAPDAATALARLKWDLGFEDMLFDDYIFESPYDHDLQPSAVALKMSCDCCED